MQMTDDEKKDDLFSNWVDSILKKPFFIGHIFSSVVIFLSYVLLAEWSYNFVLPPSSNAVFWIPSAITFALFLRARWKPEVWFYWSTALVLAEFYIVRGHGVPITTALIWSSANLMLAFSVIFLSRKLVKGPFNFTSIRQVFIFVGMICLSLIPGSIFAAFGTVIGFSGANFIQAAVSWGTSDALGIILGAPLILTFTEKGSEILGKWKEAALVLLLFIALALCTFIPEKQSVFDRSLFSFLLMFVAWSAIRFGPKATALFLLLFDVIEVWLTINGRGTFAYTDLTTGDSILTLQLLIANIAFLMLILAAAIEEQRVARLNAEIALSSRDQFISVASHELKNPLSALTMQIQMMNRFLTQNQPQENITNLVKMSEDQLKHFTLLVNDLLDVTRISAGRLYLIYSDVDLRALVENIIESFRLEFEKNGCSLTIRGDETVLCRCDRNRMEQVITNLLTNAMKFGAGKPIEISLEKLGHFVRLKVTDHGIGIAEENQSKIFNRFERAVPLDQFKGLGLGLFIVAQIVEAHKGSIRVESRLGEGACFITEIPSEENE